KPGTAYMAPVILTNVNRDMRVMREETFGPVLTVMPVHSDDEAIRLINDRRYALTSSVDDGRGGGSPHRRPDRDGDVVHEPVRLSGPGAGMDGRERFRARMHALAARHRNVHASQVVPPASRDLRSEAERCT